MRQFHILAFFLVGPALYAQEATRWKLTRSLVEFTSDAPLERISATNIRSTGLLDMAARSFAVQVPMVEFQGFNAPLQREHFNENYMASRVYPNATFAGRIIESVDLAVPGTYAVRAKGKLMLHGVEQERILPCKLVVTTDAVRVTANFDVALDEHAIRVPKVVQRKIAAVVAVTMDALFKPPSTAP
jgi:hypothetical protein